MSNDDQTLTKHDLSRKNKLIRALKKAEEVATEYRIYLKEDNRETVWDAVLVREHIQVALEKLGASVRQT